MFFFGCLTLAPFNILLIISKLMFFSIGLMQVIIIIASQNDNVAPWRIGSFDLSELDHLSQLLLFFQNVKGGGHIQE